MLVDGKDETQQQATPTSKHQILSPETLKVLDSRLDKDREDSANPTHQEVKSGIDSDASSSRRSLAESSEDFDSIKRSHSDKDSKTSNGSKPNAICGLDETQENGGGTISNRGTTKHNNNNNQQSLQLYLSLAIAWALFLLILPLSVSKLFNSRSTQEHLEQQPDWRQSVRSFCLAIQSLELAVLLAIAGAEYVLSRGERTVLRVARQGRDKQS